MSKIISRDSGAAVEKWEIPNVGQPPANAPQSMLTAGKLEEIQKAAQQEGYQAGYKQGLAKGEAEIKSKVDRLTNIFNVLQSPLKSLDEAVEQQLIALALAIAKQVIRRELKMDPGQIVAVVREAVGVLPLGSRSVRIHLHPEDAGMVRAALAGGANSEGWQVIDDPATARGDCKVTTETSRVDASVEKRLTAVAATLLGGERGGEGSSP